MAHDSCLKARGSKPMGLRRLRRFSGNGYGNAVVEREATEAAGFGARDWGVVEEVSLGTDEDRPRSPPRRSGVEGCSTPPKTTLLGDGCKAAAGSEVALNGEEGPPTLCVVLALPTSHGGHVKPRIAANEEVVGVNSARVEKLSGGHAEASGGGCCSWV